MLLTESAGGERLKDEVHSFTSAKVINLQGSTVAWVDLRRGVLLCDVLDKDAVAFYIPLPEPLNDENKVYLESPGDPSFTPDIIGRQNSIKFAEMEYRFDADFTRGGWKIVTYSWAVGSKNWGLDSVVDFEHVLENSGGMLSLLCQDRSKGVEAENIAPMCDPSLCDRDNILYLISKPNHRAAKGSLVVVDTSKKTLESVTPLSDERAIGYAVTYVHCTFSKHFNDVADMFPKMEYQTSNAFHDLHIGRENLSNTVDKGGGGRHRGEDTRGAD
ncbi:uncharacterized protein LOC120670242 isoform X2 [Panicum virgatum]|uniref:DUF1618 domain-containing protein n=1 Tax=Panicum virgatum TaxID=38727 RepID=A0A8T0T333_PANVG|nr:uncharacterized protein LOC120670242 isoform X2 [Panicum virgatum]KAG2604078.1 hypothetical protein PVAP13_4NG038800 [Panicum virgatum]